MFNFQGKGLKFEKDRFQVRRVHFCRFHGCFFCGGGGGSWRVKSPLGLVENGNKTWK